MGWSGLVDDGLLGRGEGAGAGYVYIVYGMLYILGRKRVVVDCVGLGCDLERRIRSLRADFRF